MFGSFSGDFPVLPFMFGLQGPSMFMQLARGPGRHENSSAERQAKHLPTADLPA